MELNQIITQFRSFLQEHEPLETYARSEIAVYEKALAYMLKAMYDYADNITKQLFIQTADGYYLENFHAPAYNITRYPATPSSGDVILEKGSLTNNPLNLGDVFKSVDGKEFEVKEVYNYLPNGELARLESVQKGEKWNIKENIILTPINAISGLASVKTKSDFLGGSDIESIEALRSRIFRKKTTPVLGGTASDYKIWAQEYQPIKIKDIFASENRNTADPSILSIRTLKPFPKNIPQDLFSLQHSLVLTARERAAFQQYLQDKSPLGTNIIVNNFTYRAVNIIISNLSPQDEELVKRIRQTVYEFFVTRAKPNDNFNLSRLSAVISNVTGEEGHTLNAQNVGGGSNTNILNSGENEIIVVTENSINFS